MLRLFSFFSFLFFFSFSAVAASDLYSMLSVDEYVPPLSVIHKAEQRGIGTVTEFRTVYFDESEQIFYHLAVIAPHKEVKTLLVFNARTAQLVAETQEKFSSDDVTRLNAVLFMRVKRISFSSAFKQLTQERKVFLKRANVESDLGINYLQIELVDPQGERTLALDFDSQKLLPILKWH